MPDPHLIDFQTEPHAFEARYAGFCTNCGEQFDVGAPVRYDGPYIVGVTCCVSDGRDTVRGSDRVPLHQVMPPRKTKADMCRRCFQIPSTNGTCGCDS